MIRNRHPVLGIVFAPALNLMYTGSLNEGSKKNGTPIYNRSNRRNLIAADSRQNSTVETKKFLSRNNISKILKIGSSLKLCSLAEGLIDAYPRFNGTKEWDTAAAHAVVKYAGGNIYDLNNMNELVYNKSNLLNPEFLVNHL